MTRTFVWYVKLLPYPNIFGENSPKIPLHDPMQKVWKQESDWVTLCIPQILVSFCYSLTCECFALLRRNLKSLRSQSESRCAVIQTHADDDDNDALKKFIFHHYQLN